MNSFKATLLSLTAAFSMAACRDPNMPPEYVQVAAPEWTNHIDVDVNKRSAYVRFNKGSEISITSYDQHIGQGLTARRTKRNLYITDANGVTCHWGMSDQLSSSKKINPAYIRYQDSVSKLKPR